MIQMHDVIDILDVNGALVYKNVPCYVGQANAKSLANEESSYADVTTLRALIPPEYGDIKDQVHKVIWHGRRYVIPVPIVPRMRRGRVDHYTVALAVLTA